MDSLESAIYDEGIVFEIEATVSYINQFQNQTKGLLANQSIIDRHQRVSHLPQIKDFSIDTGFCDGILYPKDKLNQLVKYLERRNIYVYGTDKNPCFIALPDGTGQMYLPANPTMLQVKHELSHYIDFRNHKYERYLEMGRLGREQSVLDRLRSNRVWNDLNENEKLFSIEYVNRLVNLNMKKEGPKK